MTRIEELLLSIRKEAEREEFPIDREIYEAAQKDPLQPILFAGDLDSPICFFARDLGRDEVHAGQPLYGQAGKLVRNGVHKAIFGEEASGADRLQKAADRVLLTNTVPYKPIGNKAYSFNVKERFRKYLESLLVVHWKGSHLIPLGNEALEWFVPYGPKQEMKAFCKNPDRFTSTHSVVLSCTQAGERQEKKVTLAPLPHPSPLNQKYFQLFPQMLMARLEATPVFGKA